jgi:hypothetical protein
MPRIIRSIICLQSVHDGTITFHHTGHIVDQWYIILRYTTDRICISSNSEGSKKLPDGGRLQPKHVGASI